MLDAAQRLRAKAQASGTLKTTEQQKVSVEQQVIVIEPADPQTIYVPAYNPTVVYGTWAYPGYPPYYWPPPPYYYPYGWGAAGFGWGVAWGFAAGAIFADADWGGGDVNIDIDRATNIDRNFDRTKVDARGNWQHDASHRKGVSYRDQTTRQKYGKDVPGREGRNDFRGRDGGPDGAGAGDRGPGGDRAGTGDRGPGGDRAGAGDRGGAPDRAAATDRAAPANRGGGGPDNAFQGVGGGSAAQRDFDRGRASNQSMANSRASAGSRPSGGAARSGGGRGGRR